MKIKTGVTKSRYICKTIIAHSFFSNSMFSEINYGSEIHHAHTHIICLESIILA